MFGWNELPAEVTLRKAGTFVHSPDRQQLVLQEHLEVLGVPRALAGVQERSEVFQ